MALPGTASAATESVSFDTPEKKALYHELLNEYRCLKCQNQTIGDSAAGLAEDLRREVFNMVSEGKQEPEITAFLVARYGDFVRYRPAFKASTALLWLGPFLLLLIGAVAVLRQSRQRAATVDVERAHLQDARALLQESRDE